jgi:hypothetical protein
MFEIVFKTEPVKYIKTEYGDFSYYEVIYILRNMSDDDDWSPSSSIRTIQDIKLKKMATRPRGYTNITKQKWSYRLYNGPSMERVI